MQLFRDSRFVRIAHRGASGHVPENTLGAFQHALDEGVDALHLDVCLTADHELAISHDVDISRTTNGNGTIPELRLDHLQSFDAGWQSEHLGEAGRGQGHRVPSLDEVLSLDDGCLGWCFDIKDLRPQCAQSLLREIAARDIADRTLVTCRSTDIIKTVRAEAPTVMTALARLEVVDFYRNLWTPGDDLSSYSLIDGAVLQIPEYASPPDDPERFYLPTEAAIAAAHEFNMPVFVATVDNEDAMASLKRIGVDGIHTAFPERLNRVLRKEADEQT